jgi:hypothetical protein
MKATSLLTLIASAVVGILIFLAVAVAARVYSGVEVPVQVTGALLGAIVTASITMLLLRGQSQAEETKERNVKVFEEKTQRYNAFLAELWKVWEDRRVTLEEVNRLMEIVLRDIIIFTHEKNTERILEALNEIATFAGKKATTPEDQTAIQNRIYDIINILSEEINLGGRISETIRLRVSELEKRVLPLLDAKALKRQFATDVRDALEASDLDLSFGEPSFKNIRSDEFLWIPIENTPVSLVFGPTARTSGNNGTDAWSRPYVEFYGNRAYGPYRIKQKGYSKDFIGPHTPIPPIPNFDRVEDVELWKSKIAAAQSGNSMSPFQQIAEPVAKHLQKHRYADGKSFVDVVNLGDEGGKTQAPLSNTSI